MDSLRKYPTKIWEKNNAPAGVFLIGLLVNTNTQSEYIWHVKGSLRRPCDYRRFI